MKSFTFAGAAVATLLVMASLTVHADGHTTGTNAAAAPSSQTGKMCRMFEPATWDNQGFMVPCERVPARLQEGSRQCAMFNPPTWDNMGFRIPCNGSTEAQAPPAKTCPVFEPTTWDNMGFRRPC